MNSPGTKQLILEVEKTTGFKVIVDTIEGIFEDAQMISARPEMPVHTIRVNKAKLHSADYIVAIQCAMLIRLWSDPVRIPVFSPIPEKFKYFVERGAKSMSSSRLPPNLVQQTSVQLAQGVLNQLRSMPIEIMTIRDCRIECPDLSVMQSEAVGAQLRLQSESFTPKIRSFAPEQIWKINVSMNSAYALNWSELSGTKLPMLPYQSTGFSEIATKLMSEVSTHPGKNSESYIQTVDAWANTLGLRTLYKWEYRNPQP
ncbi:MAG: hypothetical protein WCS94_16535 [Verrucomicrobiota bacterium]